MKQRADLCVPELLCHQREDTCTTKVVDEEQFLDTADKLHVFDRNTVGVVPRTEVNGCSHAL